MSSEGKFWNWFKENSFKYYNLNLIADADEKEKLLDVFLENLHNYCDKLFFEIGGNHNEAQELIITAEGNKNYFSKVEKLVSMAPIMNGWQVIAFKPPMGIDFITEYEDIRLNPNEIWFLPLDNENDPSALGLKICMPGYNARKEKTYLEGCYQMLDGRAVS